MKQEDNSLLKFCRYYHGEKKPPNNDADVRFLWDSERMWCIKTQAEDSFSIELEVYIDADLAHFRETDDVPVTLKAFMFAYFMKVNERATTEDFKKFYTEHYK